MPGGMHFVSGLSTEEQVGVAVDDLVAQIEAQNLDYKLEPAVGLASGFDPRAA